MKGTKKFLIICFFLILGPAWLAPFGSNADANAVHLQAQGDPQQLQQTRPEDEIFPLVEIKWPRLGAEVSPVGFLVKVRVKNLLKSCKVVLLLDGHPVDGECPSHACMHAHTELRGEPHVQFCTLPLSPAMHTALGLFPFFLFCFGHATFSSCPGSSRRDSVLHHTKNNPTNRDRFCIRSQAGGSS